MMGETSRNLMDKAKEAGSQQLEKAKEAVKQATSQQSGSQQSGQQHDGKTQQPGSQKHGQSGSQAKPHVTPAQAQQPRTQQTPTTPEKKGGW
jgi:hypothetical protein